jgi:hypothetical protein
MNQQLSCVFCKPIGTNDVLDARLHVAAEVAVVLVGHVGRHEHLDVLPDRLLLAVPERLYRALVVLLDDALLVDLMRPMLEEISMCGMASCARMKTSGKNKYSADAHHHNGRASFLEYLLDGFQKPLDVREIMEHANEKAP